MTVPGVVMLSSRAVARLVLVQSTLTGLQVVAAASVLGDVIGSKWAALFIVVVAGAQQGVNTYISKTAAETAVHVDTALSKVDAAVSHADVATARAETATDKAVAATDNATRTTRGILSRERDRDTNG